MKKYSKILLVLVAILVYPTLTFAAWWNPFSWFKKKPAPVPVVEAPKEVETKTTTKTKVDVKPKNTTPAKPAPKTKTEPKTKPIAPTSPTVVPTAPETTSGPVETLPPPPPVIETPAEAGVPVVEVSNSAKISVWVNPSYEYPDFNGNKKNVKIGSFIIKNESSLVARIKSFEVILDTIEKVSNLLVLDIGSAEAIYNPKLVNTFYPEGVLLQPLGERIVNIRADVLEGGIITPSLKAVGTTEQ